MLTRLRHFIKNIFKGGIDLFFPPLCLNCNAKLADDEQVICNQCWQAIPQMTDSILSKKDKGKFVDNLYSLWLFDENFQNIVHELKYNNCRSLGLKMGQRMGDHLKNIKIPLDECILVPVPLHAIKKRERGYNQSELIAKGISEITKIPVVTNLVKRIKNTATQTKMNKKERIENMHRAFVAQSEIVAKTVIIVDDVYTTGTTINSVAEAMKNKKGNLKIIAYTAAMPES